MTSVVLEPATAQEAASMLLDAGTHGRRIAPRGGGTACSSSSGVDAWMSTLALSSPIEHDAGDLVAVLPAGITLRETNRVLEQRAQWLPLDPPHGDRATIGGIVAANASGPRRHRHGAPRDLILGVEIALTDGRVAHAGGRVVKNVAGYDLARLMCGSRGSLGVITKATFKLAPLPAATRTVVARAAHLPHAVNLALAVAATTTTPSAIDVGGPVPQLLVRFDTTPRAAEVMADTVAGLLTRAGASAEILAGAEALTPWTQSARRVHEADGTLLTAATRPTDMVTLVEVLERAAEEWEIEWALSGRGAMGVVQILLAGDLPKHSLLVARLRETARRLGGHCTVDRATPGLADRLEALDDPGDSGPLMQAVKQQFDPQAVLPPLFGSRPGTEIR